MAKTDKAAAVAEITDAFRGSSAAVLTEYRGLTVAQLKQLRRSLGSTTTYAVVKNTLTKIAAKDAGVEGIDDLLAGPSAIAFVSGDPVEAAKGLRDFSQAHPLLVIKGGVMDGRVITAGEVAKLADLESREVLLAKLAGAMTASLSQAAALLAAPLATAARTLEALRSAATADPSLIAGAGVPAAAAEAVTETAAADSPAADDTTDAAATGTDATTGEPVADSSDTATAPAAEADGTTEG
ncbi:MAG: 50S ribosomal protein L10 [Actinomycetota bacterium]|nr:MAG: 50S ribosomal protein L10 [Actinomycetota bacterium]